MTDVTSDVLLSAESALNEPRCCFAGPSSTPMHALISSAAFSEHLRLFGRALTSFAVALALPAADARSLPPPDSSLLLVIASSTEMSGVAAPETELLLTEI